MNLSGCPAAKGTLMASDPVPIFDIAGDEPLSDDAIAAMASLLLSVVEGEGPASADAGGDA